MQVYFLRHGLAGQHGDPAYKDDSLRPLTTEGLEKMRRAALGMQTLGLNFDAILSSPYLRARQTAETVTQIFKDQTHKIHFTENLLPPASIENLLQEVLDRFSGAKDVLFVGHEPHLSQMISCLLKASPSLNIDFKKGALCSLQIRLNPSKPDASLLWLLTSKQLGLMARP